MTRKTDTKTLINAMRILARDIQSDDGVANGAISEAADRMEELQAQQRKDDDAYAKLWQMYGDLEDERDRLREALEKMLDPEKAGVVTYEIGVMQDIARTALQEDRDE